MAIQLYRKGNTHTVRGMRCELMTTDGDYHFYLDQGWVMDVKDLGKEEKPEPLDYREASLMVTEGEKFQFENTDEEEPEKEKESEDEIRAKAKAAGIKSWHRKSIDNIKKELEEEKE